MTSKVWSGLDAGTRGCSLLLTVTFPLSLQILAAPTPPGSNRLRQSFRKQGFAALMKVFLFHVQMQLARFNVSIWRWRSCSESRNYPKFPPKPPAFRYVNNKTISCLPNCGFARNKIKSWRCNVMFVGFLFLLSGTELIPLAFFTFKFDQQQQRWHRLNSEEGR